MARKELSQREKYNLLSEINPNMPAEEVIARITEFNQQDFNETNKPEIQARNQLLIDAGHTPSDWTFYTNKSHLDNEQPMGKELDNFFKKVFPPDIEYLAFNGEFLGGVHSGENVISVIKCTYNELGYSVFVRIRPKMLSE